MYVPCVQIKILQRICMLNKILEEAIRCMSTLKESHAVVSDKPHWIIHRISWMWQTDGRTWWARRDRDQRKFWLIQFTIMIDGKCSAFRQIFKFSRSSTSIINIYYCSPTSWITDRRTERFNDDVFSLVAGKEDGCGKWIYNINSYTTVYCFNFEAFLYIDPAMVHITCKAGPSLSKRLPNARREAPLRRLNR